MGLLSKQPLSLCSQHFIDRKIMVQKATIHESTRRKSEVCRNRTRREIREIAKQNGWEILPAGKHLLKARKEGHSSVPIPGHRDNAVIPYGTASSIIKSLLEPSDNLNSLQARVGELEEQLKEAFSNSEKFRADAEKFRADAEKSRDDAAAGLQIAEEIEIRNRNLSEEIHRQKCLNRELRQRIRNLIQERARQEEEMLLIANQVEQQEQRIQRTAEMLTQVSLRLRARLQRELNQIIGYLTEESK